MHYPSKKDSEGTKKDNDFLDPESHLDVLVEKGRASRLKEAEGERTTPKRNSGLETKREKEDG